MTSQAEKPEAVSARAETPTELHCARIVRFYQLIPHADGAIMSLRTARRHRTYSVAVKHLPFLPTGRGLLRWVA